MNIMARIWVYLKGGNSSKQMYIPEEEFDPDKHIIYDAKKEQEEKQLRYNSAENVEFRKRQAEARKGIDPIAFMAYGSASRDSEFKDRQEASIFNKKGKVDEGAIGNLLDVGLSGAKKRNKQREKLTGHGLRKNRYGKLIPRRKKK